jgi:hypothetical protein
VRFSPFVPPACPEPRRASCRLLIPPAVVGTAFRRGPQPTPCHNRHVALSSHSSSVFLSRSTVEASQTPPRKSAPTPPPVPRSPKPTAPLRSPHRHASCKTSTRAPPSAHTESTPFAFPRSVDMLYICSFSFAADCVCRTRSSDIGAAEVSPARKRWVPVPKNRERRSACPERCRRVRHSPILPPRKKPQLIAGAWVHFSMPQSIPYSNFMSREIFTPRKNIFFARFCPHHLG